MAYCEEDYFNLFAMKCAGCKKGLVGEYVSACGKEFHPGCFVCAVSNGAAYCGCPPCLVVLNCCRFDCRNVNNPSHLAHSSNRMVYHIAKLISNPVEAE